MWRAFFLAVGVFCILLGAQCLVVEKAVLHKKKGQAPSGFSFSSAPVRKEVPMPDWAPWSLMAAGAVTMIYSVTLRRSEAK